MAEYELKYATNAAKSFLGMVQFGRVEGDDTDSYLSRLESMSPQETDIAVDRIWMAIAIDDRVKDLVALKMRLNGREHSDSYIARIVGIPEERVEPDFKTVVSRIRKAVGKTHLGVLRD